MRDNGRGEQKMRMVVNYLALNGLTIAPDFPVPPLQTILEMLGRARYFLLWTWKQDSIRFARSGKIGR